MTIPRTTTGKLFGLVIFLAAALLAACGKPEVSGRVMLPFGPGNFRPAGNIEVLLIKGNLQSEFAQIAKEHQAKTVAEAAKATLGTLKKSGAERVADFENVVDSLKALGAEPDAVDCIQDAETAAARARDQFAARFERLGLKMATQGIDTSDPNVALEQLEAKLAVLVDEEVKRLTEEYLKTQITLDSSVVLKLAVDGPDQLCWTIINRGELKLLTVDLHLTYNGRRLPEKLAEQYWLAPFSLRGVDLRVRNRYGLEVYGIGPDTMFKECFYALTPTFTGEQVKVVESYGLPPTKASRGGTWGIEIDNAVLTDSAPAKVKPPGSAVAHIEYARRPPVGVFANELKTFREKSEVGMLVDGLSTSPEAQVLEKAEEWLALCKRAGVLDDAEAEAGKAIQALEEGNLQDPAARKALADAVTKLEDNPQKRSALAVKGYETIERQLVKFSRSDVNGNFSFPKLEQGDYTLVATNKTKMGTWVTWIVSVNVDGKVTQDLGKDNVLEGTLLEVLERTLAGSIKSPKGEKVSRVKGGDTATTN